MGAIIYWQNLVYLLHTFISIQAIETDSKRGIILHRIDAFKNKDFSPFV